MSATIVPSRILYNALQLGITAITADTDLLDDILALEDEELGKAKTYWTTHPPSVVDGYARFDKPFPILAIVLSGDSNLQDYLGVGEEALLDEDDIVVGELFKRRMLGTFTIFVYADHPDVCLWYYQIARRILNVAVPYMIARKFEDPKLDGADLAPDPRYMPDNIFVRRITIAGEYEEEWDTSDSLWTAINGAATQRLGDAGKVNVFREDVSFEEDGKTITGQVGTYTDSDEDE